MGYDVGDDVQWIMRPRFSETQVLEEGLLPLAILPSIPNGERKVSAGLGEDSINIYSSLKIFWIWGMISSSGSVEERACWKEGMHRRS
jgi:hypothetical protein